MDFGVRRAAMGASGYAVGCMARLTKQRKAAFLQSLRETCIVHRAVAAGGGGYRTFRDEYKRNPEFARQWDEALNAAKGDVEQQIYDIGAGGRVVVEERFDKDGSIVARRYAQPDGRTLLRFMAVRDERYREHKHIEQNTSIKQEVTHNGVDLSKLSDRELAQYERLLTKAAAPDENKNSEDAPPDGKLH